MVFVSGAETKWSSDGMFVGTCDVSLPIVTV